MTIKKQQTGASTTLSPDFIWHVCLLYQQALDELVSGKVVRYGINGYTYHAAPAYILAIAALEAFLNEIAFGSIARLVLKESPLWIIEQALEIEKLELKTKLLIVPELLFGKTFQKDAQPFQDLSMLIKVRNDMVHYKMEKKVPTYVHDLENRGIALPASRSKDADFIWIHKICTTEGIRWANNTVYSVANALVGFMPEEHRDILFGPLVSNFIKIEGYYSGRGE